MELLIRFLVGGAMVCLFALIGDANRPKSFAGIFGAAPSVALATLLLTTHSDGAQYAAIEARSMMIGATAFLLYAVLSARIMWTKGYAPAVVTVSGLFIWLLAAILGWLFLFGPLSSPGEAVAREPRGLIRTRPSLAGGQELPSPTNQRRVSDHSDELARLAGMAKFHRVGTLQS